MKEESFDDELFTYYKERFEAEIDRTQHLFERLSLGVAILTVLGGLVAYYLGSFKFFPFSWTHLFFYLPLACGSVFLAVSLWYFGSALAGLRKYKHVADTVALGQWVSEMRSANDATDPQVAARIRAEFVSDVGQRYKEAAAVNFYVNADRQLRIWRAYRLAMFSLAALLIASLPFFLLKSRFDIDPTPVRIISPVEVKNE